MAAGLVKAFVFCFIFCSVIEYNYAFSLAKCQFCHIRQMKNITRQSMPSFKSLYKLAHHDKHASQVYQSLSKICRLFAGSGRYDSNKSPAFEYSILQDFIPRYLAFDNYCSNAFSYIQ